jgi:hypothetical protein
MRLLFVTAAAVLVLASPAFASSVTDLTVDTNFPTNAAAAQTIYTIKFKTSPTGALAADDAIDLTIPAGASYTNPFGPFGYRCEQSGVNLHCKAPGSIAAGQEVEIDLRPITNPPTAGTGNVVTVSTAADVDPVASAPFDVAPASALESASVGIDVFSPFNAEYRITLVPSHSGRLAGGAYSRAEMTFPPEIDVSAATGTMSTASGQFLGRCGSSASSRIVACIVADGDGDGDVAQAGVPVQITLTRVPNAPGPGPYRVKVSTSSDTLETTTPDFFPGLPARPETIIDDTATRIDGATATFSFRSDVEFASFQCRLDAAAFASCPSPYTTPALATGPHRLEVRAVVAAYGNYEDLTPVVREFTILPPPAVYRQRVVVKPAGGTLKLCTAPGRGCHALTARVVTAVGRTIDARKGAVSLTVATAKGAQQTVRVSGGLFEVTQTAKSTSLTLNQRLGACSQHRTRTLRVRGAGDLQIHGRYGTATGGMDRTIKDSCRSTVVRATHGTVSVRHTSRHKTIDVRAGKRYVATRR